jgi:hypothetical protein
MLHVIALAVMAVTITAVSAQTQVQLINCSWNADDRLRKIKNILGSAIDMSI